MKDCYFVAISGHWDARSSIVLQFKCIVDQLVNRGHHVIVLVPGQLKEKVQISGNPKVFTWPSKRPTKIADAVFLFRLIRKFRPVCLIANFAAVNWMLLVGWLTSVPVRIAWYHTVAEAIKLDGPHKVWLDSFQLPRKRIVYRLATHLVSVSHFASENDLSSIYHIPREKIQVFHNLLRDPTPGHSSHAPNNIDHDVITCVARLDYSKGQDVLLKAMPRVLTSYPALQLRLIGDGPRKHELQTLATNLMIDRNVRFLGIIKHQDVLEELHSSHINIHPARCENNSLALIESIAVGTPVIASRVGGIQEIIANEENGLLVQPEDSKGLGEAICRVLGSAELRDHLSKNARRIFLSQFELESGAKKIVEWLESRVEVQRLPEGRL